MCVCVVRGRSVHVLAVAPALFLQGMFSRGQNNSGLVKDASLSLTAVMCEGRGDFCLRPHTDGSLYVCVWRGCGRPAGAGAHVCVSLKLGACSWAQPGSVCLSSHCRPFALCSHKEE